MKKTTVAAFEILERAWAAMNCSLIDIKVEFGITSAGKQMLNNQLLNTSSSDNGSVPNRQKVII